MRSYLFATLLMAPLGAFAVTTCKFEAARNLQLDLAGVRAVQVDVHSHDLRLNGGATAGSGTLKGRACASDQSILDQLQVTQRRQGDQLLIDLSGNGGSGFSLFGSREGELEVTISLPAHLPVTVNVGSGDAKVSGVESLRSMVGSGDLNVSQVSGSFSASVGSGDIQAREVGSLDLGSVGSGDVTVEGIKGDARVGSIGSGDVTMRRVGGSVRADTLGSGDLDVRDVGGSLSLGAKGSGDVKHAGVKGQVSLPGSR